MAELGRDPLPDQRHGSLEGPPLPTWLGLVRVLLRRLPSDADLAAPWCREKEVAGWLSRSAWSLALIALWRKRRAPDLSLTVWVPDLFCESSLVALRRTGARLVFYPLTDTMMPDMAACRALQDSTPADLFVLVHYFGQPVPTAAARDFCARCGAWLIEDAAHVLRPVDGVGTGGDFVLYSPHKHLAIPDGAVLVLRERGPARLAAAEQIESFGSPAAWAGQLRELQLTPGVAQNSTRARAIVWLAKRVLQKLGVRSQPAVEFLESPASAAVVTQRLQAPAHSGLARRLLAGLLGDLADVARRRERHQLLWDTLLLDDADSGPLRIAAAERPVGRDWTPYLAAFRADPPTAAEAIYNRWRHAGLPVTTWPDLPPEVAGDRGRHSNAWHVRHSRLYLPVHQSLDTRRISDRVRRPKALEECGTSFRCTWDEATALQWEQYLSQAGRSNFLQSWDYGAAKADASGWRVQRAVVYQDQEPIALMQVLQKRIAGALRVFRLNRGPVYLRALLPGEQRAVWEELARLGSLRHGRVVSVAPELGLSGSSLSLLAQLGFKQFSVRSWESVWIDLGLELGVLRKRLDGKWRNMLVSSEKAGLQLEIGSDARLFDWMLERYQEHMLEKDFTGVPVAVLLAMRKHSDGESQPLILRASVAGGAVAGICLFTHGVAATYLLGWNGHEGRKLRANQFLLWKAVVHLKERGLRWLDLGGVSEERVPGITAFKLGMNGERYELVGEYWKW